MKSKKISIFKGLLENIDFADKSEEYAESMSNLNVDDPYGQLTLRDGSIKKYSDSFTDIWSMYEYKFPTSGEVVSLINDNGYIKKIVDGSVYGVNGTATATTANKLVDSAQTFTTTVEVGMTVYNTTDSTTALITAIDSNTTLSIDSDIMANGETYIIALTLPTGATLESSFKNNYFGKDDYILMTTGNAATNYMLWYGYTQRLAADNDGLFNNTVVDSGTYRLQKAQLIDGYGVFSNIHNVIYIGGCYYITLGNKFYSDYLGLGFQSSFIERRDTSFNLIEKHEIYYNSSNIGKNKRISLTEDGTYIYAAAEDDIYKIDPTTFEVITKTSLGSSNIQAIGNDGLYLYVVTGDHIYKRLLTDLSASADTATTVASANEILVPDSGNYFYVTYTSGTDHIVQQRNLTDLAVNDSVTVYTGTYGLNYLAISDDGLTIYANGLAPTALYSITISTFTSSSLGINTIYGFCKVAGTTLRGITLGGLSNLSDDDIVAPNMVNIWAFTDSNTGDFVAGTYFYKYSIVDTDGNEYTISDPVTVQHVADSRRNNSVYICFNKNAVTSGYAYRIKYINLYRAYSTDTDAEIPATEYRFLKQIDINNVTWDNISEYTYADYHIYSYYDDTTEENMSSVTYFENSGISDNTIPRYVNAKYLEWLDKKLYVANFYCDNETYYNGILRSSDNAPAAIALYDYFDFGSAGYEIKGLSSAYGRLIAFKQFEHGIFFNGSLEHSNDYGISENDCSTKNNDDVYFANNDGIFLLRGHNVYRISEPIETTWSGLSSYTNLTMFVFHDKDRLVITQKGGKTIVYNYRYKTWVTYNSGWGFTGYFKNSSSEYIAYGNPLNTGTDYIYKITSGLDDRDTDGTGGIEITSTYNSGLIRLIPETGMNVNIQQINVRYKLVTSLTFNLQVYSYFPSTRTSIHNNEIAPTASSYLTNKAIYLQDNYGESFSWHLSGVPSTFEFAEIDFIFKPIGYIHQ